VEQHDEAIAFTGTIQLRRNSMNVLYRCPQCPDILQGTGISNEKWKELLDSGLPITVKGLQCGHVWKLSDIETESIRKQLASVTTQNPPAASIPTE
jgi:hypothetical protein